MESSNNSCNYDNPITFFLENDINNTISKLDSPYCSYSPFNYFPSSPHSHYESAYLHELCHQLLSDNQQNPAAMENPPPLEENTINENKKPAAPRTPPICRSSKKDRHSKITTACGLRDRRIRLSLDVARKFFDLQDMLGYDKASRTVDWLLKNSSLAIREVERGLSNYNMGANYASSTNSECDVSSGLDNLSGTWENAKNDGQLNAKEKKAKRGRKVVPRATIERESRNKARERARARTSQKTRFIANQSNKPCVDGDDDDYEHQVDKHYESLMVTATERDEIFANSLFFEVPWNPSAALNHPHHLGEFQFCGKP